MGINPSIVKKITGKKNAMELMLGKMNNNNQNFLSLHQENNDSSLSEQLKNNLDKFEDFLEFQRTTHYNEGYAKPYFEDLFDFFSDLGKFNEGNLFEMLFEK